MINQNKTKNVIPDAGALEFLVTSGISLAIGIGLLTRSALVLSDDPTDNKRTTQVNNTIAAPTNAYVRRCAEEKLKASFSNPAHAIAF